MEIVGKVGVFGKVGIVGAVKCSIGLVWDWVFIELLYANYLYC